MLPDFILELLGANLRFRFCRTGLQDSNIAGQQLSDRIFANELAPRLARSFCDTLQIWVSLTDGSVTFVDADFTMVSQYQAGHEHFGDFQGAVVSSRPQIANSRHFWQ